MTAAPARRIVRPGRSAEWSLGAAGRILMREERIEADWRGRATCRVHDPDLFFSAVPADVELAKSVCAGCPVRDRCEDFALKTGVRDGVWAGLDENELRSAPRARPAPAPRPVARQLAVLMPDFTGQEIARFRSQVTAGPHGPRWAGQPGRGGWGYFAVTRDGAWQKYRAHRIAFKAATGTDPGADTVIQACGDRLCLAPGCLQTEPVSETRRRTAQQRNAA